MPYVNKRSCPSLLASAHSYVNVALNWGQGEDECTRAGQRGVLATAAPAAAAVAYIYRYITRAGRRGVFLCVYYIWYVVVYLRDLSLISLSVPVLSFRILQSAYVGISPHTICRSVQVLSFRILQSASAETQCYEMLAMLEFRQELPR